MAEHRTILVTGAGGYIGSILCYHLLSQSRYKIIAIDNFTKGFREPLDLLQSKFGKRRILYYKADLRTSLSKILTKHTNIDTVIHLAALTEVDESVKKPKKYFEVNTYGTFNLVQEMLAHGIKNIVFSSTCAVYGDTAVKLIDENHPTIPMNPYGISKLLAEKILELYSRQGKLNYVILRYFNVCGASRDSLLGDSQKPSKLLLHNAAKAILGIQKFKLTCSKVKTKDGTPIRDYIDVEDIASAHFRAVKFLARQNKSLICNLGTGKGYSVLEILKVVKKVTAADFTIHKTKERKGEYPRAVANNKRVKEKLGWKPSRALESSVKSTVNWYKNHRFGWDF